MNSELQAEVNRLNKLLEITHEERMARGDEIDRLNKQLAAAQARIAELVEALRYYADANWVIDSDLKGAWLGDGEPCAVANKALATTDNLEALNRERARVLREAIARRGDCTAEQLERFAQEYLEGKR